MSQNSATPDSWESIDQSDGNAMPKLGGLNISAKPFVPNVNAAVFVPSFGAAPQTAGEVFISKKLPFFAFAISHLDVRSG